MQDICVCSVRVVLQRSQSQRDRLKRPRRTSHQHETRVQILLINNGAQPFYQYKSFRGINDILVLAGSFRSGESSGLTTIRFVCSLHRISMPGSVDIPVVRQLPGVIQEVTPGSRPRKYKVAKSRLIYIVLGDW